MKRICALFLSIVILLSQVGCSKKEISISNAQSGDTECDDIYIDENSGVPGYGT